MKKKYRGVNNKKVEAVLNKLGGLHGAQLFLNGKREIVWRTWRKVKLGTGIKKGSDFIPALDKAGCPNAGRGSNVLVHRSFKVSQKETEVELVRVSVEDIGFEHLGAAIFSDICQRALLLGLQLCPAEVGPQLRLQYLDQPNREWLPIAMQPILEGLFILDSAVFGKNVLDANYGFMDKWWDYDQEFVFMKPMQVNQ